MHSLPGPGNGELRWQSAYCLIGLAILAWSTAFIGIRIAVQSIHPIDLAIARFAVASLVLIVVVAWRGVRFPNQKHWLSIGFVGLLGVACYNTGLNYGQSGLSAGLSSIMVNTMPLFSAIIARRFLEESFSSIGWFGLLLAFIGIGVIGISRDDLKADAFFMALLCGAAVCQAVSFLIQKKLLLYYQPFELIVYMMWIGTAFLLPLNHDVVDAILTSSSKIIAIIVFLGVVPSIFGFWFYTKALTTLPASRASSFIFLIPPVVILMELVGLSEVPTISMLVGGGITMMGVYLANRRSQSSATSKVKNEPRSKMCGETAGGVE